MSLAGEFLSKIEPISAEDIQSQLEKRLTELSIEGVYIEDVEVDIDGFIDVFFTDDDGDEMLVSFFMDPDEGAVALIADDETEEDWLLVDLDPLAPPVQKTSYGEFINLSGDLSWLNRSAMLAILQAGNIGDDDVEKVETQKSDVIPDPYGYIRNEDFEFDETQDEVLVEGRKISVVRGGKKVRLAVVRKIRRRVLTGKQKTAIRKAVRKRKVKVSRSNRKRKRSLKVRKRMSLKTPKLGKFRKIAGTANRRR